MKREDIAIRPADLSDAEKIRYVLLEAFKPYKNYYTEEAFNATVLSIDVIVKRIKDPNCLFLVAVVDGRIVGTVSLRQKNHDCLHISSMAVDPDSQKQGIGLRLLEFICDVAREKNLNHLRLESFKPLKRAVRLYEEYGFRSTGEKRDYYGIEVFEMMKQVR